MGLEPASVIGRRYTLTRPLDRGGMGMVWAARDDSGNALAIKFLNHAFSPRALRRFRREAKALEQLDHPNVVRIIAHGFEDNCPYIAMELLRGQSLGHLLAESGALAPGEVLRLLRDAGQGLAATHALGIVHRDVKPSNLFLCRTDDGRLVTKVIDFGIATGTPFEQDSHSGTTGMIGSPAYMSPEQARGEDVDQSADVWSLAVVAFQMLTGREPFGGANVPETLQRICAGQVPRATSLASGLPPGTDELFFRAFASKRRDRFQTTGELLAALNDVCAKAPNVAAVTAAPVGAVPRRSGGRSETTASYVNVSSPIRRTKALPRALLVGIGVVAVAVGSSWLKPGDLPAHAAKPAPKESTQAIALQPALPPVGVSNPIPSGQAPLPPSGTSPSAANAGKRANLHRTAGTRHDVPLPQSQLPVPSDSATPASSAIAVGLDPVFGLRVSQTDGHAQGNDSASPSDGLSAHDSAPARGPGHE